MMTDFRKFYTDFKKLSFEFLVFKESYPIRTEAISFINMIIKKQTCCIKGNRDIYDELIKNFKKYNLIGQETVIIKNSIKGPKIHSVFLLISIILNSKNIDLRTALVKHKIIFINFVGTGKYSRLFELFSRKGSSIKENLSRNYRVYQQS